MMPPIAKKPGFNLGSIVHKMAKGARNLTKRVPALKKEARDNEQRDIKPDDIESPDELLDGIDFNVPVRKEKIKNKSDQDKAAHQLARRQLIVSDVMRDWKHASNARQSREENWFLSAAFERSNQWVEYDRESRQLRPRWRDADSQEYYKTINKIAPLVRQNTSRALSSDPDLDFIPIAPDSEIDRLSAKQSRQIWKHAKKCSKWQDVKEEAVYFGHCFPVFFKVSWDAEAEDDVPQFELVEQGEDAENEEVSGDAGGFGSSPGDGAGNPVGVNAPPVSGTPPPMAQQAAGQQSKYGAMAAAMQQGQQEAMAEGFPPEELPQADELNALPEPEQQLPAEPIVELPKMLRIVGSVRAQVGMTKIEYISPFRAYPDPDASRYEDIRYFIDARRIPVSELQTMFGGAAYLVNPDKGSGGEGMDSQASDARLSAITGDNRYSASESGDYVTLIERYEFTSPKYPQGRYTAVADGQLLKHTVLEDQEYQNPFVPFYYQRDVNSIWGRGIVPDMIDSQVDYNSAHSHMMSRMRMDKLTILADEAAGLRPDDYIGGNDYRKIYHKPGRAVTLQSPPADWAKYQMVMDICYEQMKDMIGLHGVSQGDREPVAESGRAIYLRQQADSGIIREYTRRIELAELEVANRCISCFSRYATEPRLIGIDDEQKGDIPLSRLFMPDLMKAGKSRCEVTTGSAMPETPGAEEAQLEHWYEMQLFGPVGTPGAAKSFLEALPTLKSSKIVDNTVARILEQEEKAMEAAAAMEDQKQQAAMQAAQQASELDTQQKLILLEAEGKQKAELLQLEYQLKSSLPTGEDGIVDESSPMEEQQARVAADIEIGTFQAGVDAQEREHSAALDVQKTAAIENIKHQHTMERESANAQRNIVQSELQGKRQETMQDKTLTAQQETAKLAAKNKTAVLPKK